MGGPGSLRSGIDDNALKSKQDSEPEDLDLVLDFSTDLEDILCSRHKIEEFTHL